MASILRSSPSHFDASWSAWRAVTYRIGLVSGVFTMRPPLNFHQRGHHIICPLTTKSALSLCHQHPTREHSPLVEKADAMPTSKPGSRWWRYCSPPPPGPAAKASLRIVKVSGAVEAGWVWGVRVKTLSSFHPNGRALARDKLAKRSGRPLRELERPNLA